MMKIDTLQKIILSIISMLVASEVVSWVYVIASNMVGILSGLAVIAVYWFCGKKARESAKSTGWFLLPCVLFTAIPLVVHFWPSDSEEEWSLLQLFFKNIPFLVSFILPVTLLVFVYFKLPKIKND